MCEVCGKSPVEKVLYPVSVHFKGSGFYSTDYGRVAASGRPSHRRTEVAATPARQREKSDKDSARREAAAAADRRVRREELVSRSRSRRGKTRNRDSGHARLRADRRRVSAARRAATIQPDPPARVAADSSLRVRRPGGGGCGAERPVNIEIAAAFSSVPISTDSPPIVCGSPPRRQWSARAALARNLTQPSCSSCPAREVGRQRLDEVAADEGQPQERARPDELVGHRLDHGLLALAAREVVLGRVEPVLADA